MSECQRGQGLVVFICSVSPGNLRPVMKTRQSWSKILARLRWLLEWRQGLVRCSSAVVERSSGAGTNSLWSV